jgi:hypothetical protein
MMELRAALDTWIMETNDQGRHRESPEILQYWESRMKENYDERIRKMLDERNERLR